MISLKEELQILTKLEKMKFSIFVKLGYELKGKKRIIKHNRLLKKKKENIFTLISKFRSKHRKI